MNTRCERLATAIAHCSRLLRSYTLMGGLCSKPPPSATAAPNVVSVVDLTSNAGRRDTEEESVVSHQAFSLALALMR